MMRFFKLILLIFFLGAEYCSADTVKLCEDADFKGLCIDMEYHNGCVKIPHNMISKASSVRIHGCVKLWSGEDCSMYSVTIKNDVTHLQDFNDVARAISNCQYEGKSVSSEPPESWTEHWFDHNQTIHRVYYDDEIAVYFDNDVDKSIKWPFTYLHKVWAHTKKVYGDFGPDKRLFAIFHTGKYGGGHPSTYFDASHDFRNVIDCGKSGDHVWVSGKDNDIDMPTHEVAHIVEGATKGVHNSPAFGIWKDSKWAEIFQYDVYKSLGMNNDTVRWYNQMIRGHDNFPRENTYWFRDWFYPIYNDHGQSKALNNFFDLLSKYFPKTNTASFHRKQYTRGMNHGEFIHFWSGAAHTNLKALATKAFGWTDQYDKEFNNAVKDFPDIKY